MAQAMVEKGNEAGGERSQGAAGYGMASRVMILAVMMLGMVGSFLS